MMAASKREKTAEEPAEVLMFYLGPDPAAEAKRYPGRVWWPGKKDP